ncbi:MAG: glycosyltransferase family 4 protein [Microthrixaceae bacterium]
MRIGLIAPPWVAVPPVHYGGTEAVVDRLARGFQKVGHEVFLWATGDSTCPVARGYTYRSAQPGRIGMATVEARHVIAGYEAIAAWGPDVIHDHTVIGPLYSRRFVGLPVATTNHGPFHDEATALYRAVTPGVAVIAISQDQASHARGFPISAVIHHGLDICDIPIGDGVGDERGEYFMFLGRMAPEKGLSSAVQLARRKGVRLLIAAKMREPLETEYFAENVEPFLNHDIEYVGEVDNLEKMALLRGAKALVNPICWPEPFGLVMVEALACGTPVVSLNNGSASEIIRDGITGIVCRDMEEMAERLSEVEQIERNACRIDAESRFTTERMVEQHVELFTELIARSTAITRSNAHPNGGVSNVQRSQNAVAS